MSSELISIEQATYIADQLWLTDEDSNPPIIYAVLDGARDKRIHEIVKNSGLRHSCLYDGKLTYELTVAAPYLIRLEKDQPFVIELIQQAWGNSWGIFILTHAPTTLVSVRRNCKKLAFVKDEQNKKLLFRYYDPRVLRTFLPSCRESELKQIFGPVASYAMEDDTASAMHFFNQKESGFKQRKKSLPDFSAASMRA